VGYVQSMLTVLSCYDRRLLQQGHDALACVVEGILWCTLTRTCRCKRYDALSHEPHPSLNLTGIIVTAAMGVRVVNSGDLWINPKTPRFD
jgi:hypothetical protein